MFSGRNVLKMSTSRSSRLNIGAGLASKLFKCQRREEETEDKETRALTFLTFINFFIRRAKTKTNKIHNPNISDLKHMHNFALHTLRHKQLYFRNWTTNQASNRKCAKTWRALRDVNSRSTQRERTGRAHNSHCVSSYCLHFTFCSCVSHFFRRHSFIWNQFYFFFTVCTWILSWDQNRFNTWTTKILKSYERLTMIHERKWIKHPSGRSCQHLRKHDCVHFVCFSKI